MNKGMHDTFLSTDGSHDSEKHCEYLEVCSYLVSENISIDCLVLRMVPLAPHSCINFPRSLRDSGTL